MNQIIEKCTEYQIVLYIALIDYNKAFDFLKHRSIVVTLKNKGVRENYTNIIKEMYTNLKARIVTDKEGPFFKIKKGDPLSPILFNSAVEEIFREIN